MKEMTLEEIKLKQDFGRKVYLRNNRTAIIAKYLSSKFWNPFDWYKVKIIDEKA